MGSFQASRRSSFGRRQRASPCTGRRDLVPPSHPRSTSTSEGTRQAPVSLAARLCTGSRASEREGQMVTEETEYDRAAQTLAEHEARIEDAVGHAFVVVGTELGRGCAFIAGQRSTTRTS